MLWLYVIHEEAWLHVQELNIEDISIFVLVSVFFFRVNKKINKSNKNN